MAGNRTRAVFVLAGLFLILFVKALTVQLGYLPDSSKKAIVVTVEHRGSSEAEIERSITDVLEDRLAGLRGLAEMHSISDREESRVHLLFADETDLGQAYVETRDRVQEAYEGFPSSVQRPFIQKTDPDSRPVFVAALGIGDEDLIKSRYRNVEGSGEVVIGGGTKKELLVAADPQKLAVRGAGYLDLSSALADNFVLGGFGSESGLPSVMDVRPRSAEDLASRPLAGGLRWEHLTVPRLAEAEPDSIGRINGREGLIVYVHESGDADTVALCRGLRRLTDTLPDSLVLYDKGRVIETGLSGLALALFAGIVSAALCFALLLRRAAAGLLLLTAAFAFLSGCAALSTFGLRLDLASASGIVVGLAAVASSVWDGFCGRGRPSWYGKLAALAGLLVLPFGPLELRTLLGGFGLGLGACVASGAVFSLWGLPALGFAPPSRSGIRTRVFRPRVKAGLLPRTVLLLVAALALASFVKPPRPSESAFNSRGSDSVAVIVEFPSGTSMKAVYEAASQVEATLAGLAQVRFWAARYERERATVEAFPLPGTDAEDLRRVLAAQPVGGGFLYFPEAPKDAIRIGIRVLGSVLPDIKAAAVGLAQRIRSSLGAEVVFHFKEVPQSHVVKIDLDAAARTGADPSRVHGEVVRAASAPVAGKWLAAGQEYDVRVRGPRLRTIDQLLDLPIPVRRGGEVSVVSLSGLARLENEDETGRIYRTNRRRSFAITAEAASGRRDELVRNIEDLIAGYEFPSDTSAEVDPQTHRDGTLEALALIALAAVASTLALVAYFQRLPPALAVAGWVVLGTGFALGLAGLLGFRQDFPLFAGLVLAVIGAASSLMVGTAGAGGPGAATAGSALAAILVCGPLVVPGLMSGPAFENLPAAAFFASTGVFASIASWSRLRVRRGPT